MKSRIHKPVLSLRKPIIAHSKSALLLSTTALLVSASINANAQQNDEPIVLDTMHIEERTSDTNPYAEAGAPYKAKISGDSRHVKPLADTPQTISVLTQTAIQESGKTDLSEILAAQPGITLGTGENGNAFGDRYIIRGHEARSDVFVDGLRDPGMTTRESFAVEQIEITKGPSSTFAGRGTTGGAINAITKQASTEYNFNKLQAGLGTDNYRRIALDSNIKINDDTAIRANLLYSEKDVPDRAPADKERTGIALSGSYQATEKLNFIADYYYLDAKDSPDLGSLHTPGSTTEIVKNLPAYVQNEDFLNSKINVATLSLGYDFNDTLRLDNTTRYGTTDNGYVTTGAINATRSDTDPIAPGAAAISLDNHQGWQEVDYFVNQSNIFMDANIANTKNQFVFSIEYSDMNVTNGNYKLTASNTPDDSVTTFYPGYGDYTRNYYYITDGNGNYLDNINSKIGRQITKIEQDSDFSVETISLSVMDTITFNEHWSLFLGLRVDSFDYKNEISGRNAGLYDYSDTLFNGHIGLVYNINDDANVYATYSTSSNINGGESDVGSSCGYGGLCGNTQQVKGSKPEQTENIELGSKWNVLNDKLLLTAAIFQITKSDVMESIGDSDYEALGSLNTGKNRVKGIEVSAVGNITEELSVQFGAALMDSEILETEAKDRSGNPVDIDGKPLANFADNSAYFQLRYQATSKFAVGSIVTYSSESYVGQPDSPAGNYEIPSYTVLDLFASYKVNEQLNVRLNIGNVTDKDYYLAGYRNGAFVYIGNARNAQLTVEYGF
ncbi:MAG: TonB-dependent siderophore receptor [Colwellia sp.]|nr:MAG: TonB-dependent siderophore receptor [Colwellia sp.]